MVVPRWLLALLVLVLVGALGWSAVLAQGLIQPSAGRGELQHRYIEDYEPVGYLLFHAIKDTASGYTCYISIQSQQMQCVK